MNQPQDNIDRAEGELRDLLSNGQWNDACERAAGAMARLMVDGGVDWSESIQRLRSAGISSRGAKALLRAADKAKSKEERDAHEAELDGATPVCPHCLAPVEQFDHFCPKCRGPVTAYASIDPMGQIYSAGRAYRMAVTARPRGIVVLGMWLIFAPALASILYWAGRITGSLLQSHSRPFPTVEFNPPTIGPIVWFLTTVGLLALYSVILYKVTKRWLQTTCQPEGNGETGDDESEQPDGIDRA